MAIKENDFIEINYTGRTEDGVVFDTTVEQTAKENGLAQDPEKKFKPVIICVGKGQILLGIDHKLIGKDIGKHKFHLQDIEAFGKKNAKLIQLIPMSAFKKQGMNPQPGMELNIDDKYGIVKTVGGGRVLVDFNHPLASHELDYEIEVKRIVTDLKEQVLAFFGMMQLPVTNIEVKEDKTAVIYSAFEMPKEIQDAIIQDLLKVTGTKKFEFKVDEKAKAEMEKTASEHAKEHEKQSHEHSHDH
ncbi:peptidylprolyl isomerase [Candidatus Woesearchaeota archaeon]|nr:peptidylprolyl isomerase [Candidatus Woesearchaeota archaeon]